MYIVVTKSFVQTDNHNRFIFLEHEMNQTFDCAKHPCSRPTPGRLRRYNFVITGSNIVQHNRAWDP